MNQNSACILWAKSVDSKGYGQVKIPHTRKNARAHRLAYEEAFGPIPPGFEVIHSCRVRRCINPEHLVAVTVKDRMLHAGLWEALSAVLLARRHCKHGHPMDGLFFEGRVQKTRRYCKTCNRLKSARQKSAVRSN